MASEYLDKIIKSSYPDKGGGLKFISAVAGSGKSTALVEESFTLHTLKTVPSHKQLLITFSRASARDLKSKIKKRYRSVKYKKLCEVSTIHTLGSNILKRYFGEQFTILSAWESLVMVRTIMIDLGVFTGVSKENDNMRYKSMVASEMLLALETLKANVAFGYEEFANGSFNYLEKYHADMKVRLSPRVFSAITKKYEAKKLELGVYDYTDLVFRTYYLLSKNPDKLRMARRAYRWIADDEAQDQTKLEWLLILTLAKGKNFMCVGDSCQTIYEWRNADPTKFNLSFLSKYFATASEFELPVNYRSTANIVEFGNLVREAKGDTLKAIPYKGKEAGSLSYDMVKNTTQEALLVCKEIAEYVEKGEYAYKDFAVIARTNSYLTTVMEPIFLSKGIPYKVSSKTVKKTLDKKDIMVMMRYVFSYILNPKAFTSLLKVAEYMRGFGDASINSLLSVMSKGEALETLETVPKVSDNSLKRMVRVKRDLYKLSKKVDSVSISDFYNFITLIDGTLRPETKEGIYSNTKAKEFKKVVGSYYQMYIEDNDKPTFRGLLESLIEDLDGNNTEGVRDVVRLSTVHAEKGLSAKVTYCVGFSLPKINKTVKPEDFNVFYVQVSRAEEKLRLITAEKYVTKEGKVRKATLDPVFRIVLNSAMKKSKGDS